MIDGTAIIEDFLKASAGEAGTALVVAIGNRVSTPVAMAGFKNTQAALVFHVEPESIVASGGWVDSQAVIKCYGGSALFSAARTIYRLVVDRVHGAKGETVSSGRVQSAFALPTIIAGNDPDGYPMVLLRVAFGMTAT